MMPMPAGIQSVAINQFPSDSDAEIVLVRETALQAGANDVVPANVHRHGGAGGEDLARALVEAIETPGSFRTLYDPDEPLKKKIETIARLLYGAGDIHYLPPAERSIRLFTRLGYGSLPVCMAKTHLSLSGDRNLKGRPEGFELTVRQVRLSAGAGFVYPLLGEVQTMPGLGSQPGGVMVDIDEDGTIHGLF